MLKRNAEWLPKLLPEKSLYNELFSNPDLAVQEAAFGIVDVQGRDCIQVQKIEAIFDMPKYFCLYQNQMFLSKKEIFEAAPEVAP